MLETMKVSGNKNGVEWSVEVLTAVDDRFYGYVEVGSACKVTLNTYKAAQSALDAGCQLMADTFAELEDREL